MQPCTVSNAMQQAGQGMAAKVWKPWHPALLHGNMLQPYQGLAASCDCDINDVLLLVEFPKLQVFLVVVSSTCASTQHRVNICCSAHASATRDRTA
jgi:hypothetical protein